MKESSTLDQLREAEAISERLGTWVLYEVKAADDLEHLVGFMVYVTHGLAAQRDRARNDSVKRGLVDALTNWRRATRWVSMLDRSRYREIAGRFLDRLEVDRRLRRLPALPYYVGGQRHPWLTVSDRPPRGPGRPKTRLTEPLPRAECSMCRGQGFV